MVRENLFTYDLDNEESIIDRDAFVIRRESPELAAKSDKIIEDSVKSVLKGVGKGVLVSLLPLILAVLGCAFLYAAITGYSETGAIPGLPALLTPVAFALAACAFVFSKRFKKKDSEDTDRSLDAMDADLDAYRKEMKAELSIPNDTKELEIFTVSYSTENGENGEDCYVSASVDLFEEGENLCMLFSGGVIVIPKAEIEGVFQVDAPVVFDSWMKDDAEYNEGRYAIYKIEKSEIDDEERYTMQGFYSLRFTHEDTPFEVVIPLYERETLLSLGFVVKEENE